MTAPTNEERLLRAICKEFGVGTDYADNLFVRVYDDGKGTPLREWLTHIAAAARLSESTKRVLIVDDNATLGKELAKRLSENGGAVPTTGTHDAESSSTTTEPSSVPPTPSEAREAVGRNDMDRYDYGEGYPLVQKIGGRFVRYAQAAARIERLERDRKLAIDDIGKDDKEIETLHEIIERQSREIEGLSKDAERYRWIESNPYRAMDLIRKICHPDKRPWWSYLRPAIDAALKEHTHG